MNTWLYGWLKISAVFSRNSQKIHYRYRFQLMKLIMRFENYNRTRRHQKNPKSQRSYLMTISYSRVASPWKGNSREIDKYRFKSALSKVKNEIVFSTYFTYMFITINIHYDECMQAIKFIIWSNYRWRITIDSLRWDCGEIHTIQRLSINVIESSEHLSPTILKSGSFRFRISRKSKTTVYLKTYNTWPPRLPWIHQ